MSPTDLPQASVAEPSAKPILFHGKAGEYFGIFITNLALTIVTLGIYSAWAKVRNKRYFYGNTEVLGSTFEYLATGKQLLLGRVIALIVFLGFTMLANLSLVAYGVFIVVFMAASPWLINAGLRFNAYNSAYRGVRFRFKGSYWGAVKTFVLFPLLAMISLGLAAPWVIKRMQEYIVTGHSYGNAPFQFFANAGEYIKPILILVLVTLVSFSLGFYLMIQGTFVLGFILIFVGYLSPLAFKPILFNIYWQNVQLKGNRFYADLPIGTYIWVFISNSFAIALTLGLAYPWTQIRMARLQADALHTVDVGNLDQIVAEQANAQSAIGEELGDIYDVDVGFGV